MAITRYKLYSNNATTLVAADSMVFQRRSRVKSIMFGVLFNSITDNASLTAAISRQPLNELGVATAGGAIITNVLAVFKMVSNFVTSGLAQPFGNLIVPCDDVFQVGDPLYLNLAIAGTLAPDIDVILVCDE